MTREAKVLSAMTLIAVPTIQYGGYFLLTALVNKGSGYMDNPLRQNFFRAGHAHVGVIVILSLVCQILADAAVLPSPLMWLVRPCSSDWSSLVRSDTCRTYLVGLVLTSDANPDEINDP